MEAASSFADDEFNEEAFQKTMLDSGFTRRRALFQTFLGELVERVTRSLSGQDSYEWMMTGSYVEGWGNHLFRLDGVTGFDSDIDWSEVVKHKVYHLIDTCQSIVDCINREDLKLKDGHISVKNCSQQPAFATDRCGLRPDADECHAYPCCSYPEIRRNEGECEEFREKILNEEFDNEKPSDDVHFVRASVPGKQNQMRLSCTRQERKIMGRLTTVQGQLFVLLKYLIKSKSRVLTQSKCETFIISKGLKSYHAKTLLITLLRGHFVADANQELNQSEQAAQLMYLLDEALKTLLKHLTATNASSIPQVMSHALLKDAGLYLKVPKDQSKLEADKRKDDQEPKKHLELIRKIRGDIERLLADDKRLLRAVLLEYQKRLMPKGQASGCQEEFLFAPLLLLPRITAETALERTRESPSQEGADKLEKTLTTAYRLVWHALKALGSSSGIGDDFDWKLKEVKRHKCLRTAAVCLRIMRQLKESPESASMSAEETDYRVQRRIKIPESFSNDDEACEAALENFVAEEDCLWGFHYFNRPGTVLNFDFVMKALKKRCKANEEEQKLPIFKKLEKSTKEEEEARTRAWQLLHQGIVVQNVESQPSVTVNFDCLFGLFAKVLANDSRPWLEFLEHAYSCLKDPREDPEKIDWESRKIREFLN